MRGAKRARFIDATALRTIGSGTSVVGEVTLSTRPSRSTVKCISTPFTSASESSSCERSTELIEGRIASGRGFSRKCVLPAAAKAFQASA
jgi:hypothetical protein